MREINTGMALVSAGASRSYISYTYMRVITMPIIYFRERECMQRICSQKMQQQRATQKSSAMQNARSFPIRCSLVPLTLSHRLHTFFHSGRRRGSRRRRRRVIRTRIHPRDIHARQPTRDHAPWRGIPPQCGHTGRQLAPEATPTLRRLLIRDRADPEAQIVGRQDILHGVSRVIPLRPRNRRRDVEERFLVGIRIAGAGVGDEVGLIGLGELAEDGY